MVQFCDNTPLANDAQRSLQMYDHDGLKWLAFYVSVASGSGVVTFQLELEGGFNSSKQQPPPLSWDHFQNDLDKYIEPYNDRLQKLKQPITAKELAIYLRDQVKKLQEKQEVLKSKYSDLLTNIKIVAT